MVRNADDEPDDEDVARRRDEVVKRMLGTKPDPNWRPTKPEGSKRGRPPKRD
jgi:hypothetical protein